MWNKRKRKKRDVKGEDNINAKDQNLEEKVI